MDPNANLLEQEAILTTRQRPDGTLHNYDRYELHDLRRALHDWLCTGGFAPDWSKAPHAAKYYGHIVCPVCEHPTDDHDMATYHGRRMCRDCKRQEQNGDRSRG
jgi:hypothetical protein